MELQNRDFIVILTDIFFHLVLLHFNSLLLILQFWAAYVPCEAQYKDAVQISLEQIDVIQRLTDRYTPQLTKCTSAYGKRIKFYYSHC